MNSAPVFVGESMNSLSFILWDVGNLGVLLFIVACLVLIGIIIYFVHKMHNKELVQE